MDFYILLSVFVLLFGIAVGSFLNVCIFRIPVKESIVTGGSHCMSCGHKLKWYDLFPLFSFVFLKGKCRYCKAKLSPRYPIIELLNGVCWLLCFFAFGLTPLFIGGCLLSSLLICVAMIDIDTGEIPNRFQVCILLISPLFIFFSSNPWWEHLIGFFAASLILFVLALLTNGFGGGDIKLMAVCGLCLGYKGILFALFCGIIFGGIQGAVTLLLKKGKRNENGKLEMPFGPALCLAVFASMFIAETAINWYLSIIL